MVRYRGWIFFGLGLFLALAAGAVTFVALQQQRTAADTESRRIAMESLKVPMLKVPVAARTLEPGIVLSDADYVLKDFPSDLIPAAALTQTVALDRQILTQSIGQGETFRPDRLLGNAGATISQQIEPGKVLVAFPVLDLLSQSNLVQDGDRIDLLLTIESAKDSTTDTRKTAITLQNIQVFKVLRPSTTEEKEKKAATAFLCSLTPQDSVLLKFIKDSGGTIDFVLRSTLDQEVHMTKPVDMQELNQRYLAR